MPLLWLSLAFLTGLVLGAAVQWPWQVWLAAGGLSIALAVVEFRVTQHWESWQRVRRAARLPLFLLLAALCLGVVRYQTAHPPLTACDLAWYNDSGPAQLTGTISAPPDRRDTSTLMEVDVSTLSLSKGTDTDPQCPVTGRVLVTLPPGAGWRYGEAVILTGTPQSLDDMSAGYRAYLERRGIYSVLRYPRVQPGVVGSINPLAAALEDVRQSAYHTINSLLPQPEAALLNGILLGMDQDLPPSVVQAFRDSGTAHIIAISGFNIAILAGLWMSLFGRLLGVRRGTLAALIVIALYTLMVGGGPSVVRAAVMGSVGMLGALIGRRQTGVNSLGFTAALMALLSPDLPWDVSFQLSFTATLGLVLFAGRWQQSFADWATTHLPAGWSGRISGPVGEYVLATLAAQLATLPVIIYHFQRVSLSAILANPLVLPVQPLVMMLGGLALLTGMVWLPTGQLFAAFTWPALAYTIRMTEALARLPQGAQTVGEVGLLIVVIYYAVLLGLAFERPRAWLRRLSPTVLLIGALLLAAIGVRSVLSAPDGRLHVTILGVSNGPVVLVQTPGGAAYLINTTSQVDVLTDALGRRLPLLDRRLTGVILPASSRSGLSALPDVFERYPPGQVYWSQTDSTSAQSTPFLDSLHQAGGELLALSPGVTLDLGEGARLHVGEQTSSGLSLWLEYGGLRLVLPGASAPGAFGTSVLAGAVVVTEDTLGDWPGFGAALVVRPTRDGLLLAGEGGRPLRWLALTSDGSQMWSEGE